MTLKKLNKKLLQLQLLDFDTSLLYCIAIGLGISPNQINIPESDVNTLNQNIFTKDYTLDKIVFKDAVIKTTSENLDEFITKYRLIFKGVKTGSMGDATAIKSKLLRWRSENPNYSLDQILAAAQHHIDNTDPRYTRLAHYFIYKKDHKGEEISTLSACIDEADPINQESHTKFL